jgi:hypothetical protein
MSELEPTEHQLRLGSHVSAAVESYAKWHSAALVLFFAENHVEVGSATCVQFGDRFLLATAAHNIAELDSEDIRIVAPLSTSEAWLPIASRNWRLEDLLDVGWLEITETVALSSGLSFIDAEMLAPFEEPTPESLYLAQGIPAELSSASGRTISLTSLAYMTIPVEPGSTAPHLEIVLDYSGSESPLPIPEGMSGGGIWSIQNNFDLQVWAPENSRLVGITDQTDS